MALFFDQDWFRTALARVGKTHDELARAAGLSMEELVAVWKDQMEVTAAMVKAFAEVLEAAPEDVAKHCGIGTPVPSEGSGPEDPAVLQRRIDDLERELDQLKSKLDDKET